MTSKLIRSLEGLEEAKPFIGTKRDNAIYSNATHLIGFCFDGTTSFRPGSRQGPNAIRETSFGLETYSPYLDRDLEEMNVFDLGNLPIYPSKWNVTNKYFEEYTAGLNLKKDNIKIVTLGGEHSVSYGPICLYLKNYEDLVLLHLDAHTDLRDGYLEEKYSHASIIRRVWDHMKPSHTLLQYGIRSGLKEEFDFMKKNNTLMTSLKELCEKLEAIPSERPIYLTLDLDYFDPAYMPGTGTPEAGGEDFHSFVKLMKILKTKNFVGADIVELAPQLDPTNNSACFASKVTREVMLALKR
jgi:agmatinase